MMTETPPDTVPHPAVNMSTDKTDDGTPESETDESLAQSSLYQTILTQLDQDRRKLLPRLKQRVSHASQQLKHAIDDVQDLAQRLAKAQTRVTALTSEKCAAAEAEGLVAERVAMAEALLAAYRKPSIVSPEKRAVSKKQANKRDDEEEEEEEVVEVGEILEVYEKAHRLENNASSMTLVDSPELHPTIPLPEAPKPNTAANIASNTAPSTSVNTASTSVSKTAASKTVSNSLPATNATHFALPCLAYNSNKEGSCPDDNCPFPHVCLYCTSPKHTFVVCVGDKPCICPYYNTPTQDTCNPHKCGRLNACLFCLGNHPISECPLDHPDTMRNSCNNWNATGLCVAALKSARGCSHTHACTRCASPDHPTIACPLNAATLLENEKLDWIHTQQSRGQFVTRREFCKSGNNGFDGLGSGSGGRNRGGSDSLHFSRRVDNRDRSLERGRRGERGRDGRGRDRDRERERDRDRDERERERDRDEREARTESGGVKRARRDDDTGRESRISSTSATEKEEDAARRSRTGSDEDRYASRRTGGSATGSRRTDDADDGKRARDDKKNPCFQFNQNKCARGTGCWYRHVCMRCKSSSHGEFECRD
ncbi:hypothetical protein HDU77_001106 [Chytriomyces hyalinus]|nr:hypothetical protein HDU77_001106 [Chytriomyces hyalinus]